MSTTDIVKGRYSSYKLLNDVGHGGSARVYRAQDLATQREVAVKQLFGNRPQDREDWLHEVDALNTLNNHKCPHVIQYLDHMQQHDKLFLVEEYAERGSLLRELKQGGPMPETRVCAFAYQMLTALHRMAQWGVVHGDLKASNLLLFNNDVVKLTDFALRSRGAPAANNVSLTNSNTNSGRDDVASSSPKAGLASTVSGHTSSLEGGSSDFHFTASITQSRLRGTTGAAAAAVAPTSVHNTNFSHHHNHHDSHNKDNNYSIIATAKTSMGFVESGGERRTDPTSLFFPSSLAPRATPLDFRGSVYWAAPEVLAGESRMSAASDVWSVACTTIELLVGMPPYFDRSIPNATHHILKYYYEVVGEECAVGAASGAAADTTGGRTSEKEKNDRDNDTAGKTARDKAAATPAGRAEDAAFKNVEAVANDGAYCKEAGRDESNSSRSSDDGTATQDDAWYSQCTRDKLGSNSLVPPLPDELHISEECRSFLRSCLRLRPCERPSAGELLQHPWFLNVVVPQLLQAAREGRGMGDDDTSYTINVYLNNNNNRVCNTTATAGGNRFAVIVKWVELNLLNDQPARCEAWLRSDALPLLVPVLTPRIMTPTYIGNVMWCFSRFAEANSSLAPLFLNQLGATELWCVEELTSACDADHLVTLFCKCCMLQDPLVRVFTPTHPSALRFVLGLEKAKVLECVEALHHLFVDPPSLHITEDDKSCPRLRGTPTTAAAAAVAADVETKGSFLSVAVDRAQKKDREAKENNIEGERSDDANNNRFIESPPRRGVNEAATTHQKDGEREQPPQQDQEQQQQRRAQARERLLRDGGAGVLCHCVEVQCKAAFLSGVPPLLEWNTMNRFLEILAVVEALPGGQELLWGFPSEDDRAGPLNRKTGGAAPTAAASNTAASIVTPRSGVVANNSSNNSIVAVGERINTQPPLNSRLSVTPRESITPSSSGKAFPNEGASAGTTTATATVPTTSVTNNNNNNTAGVVHSASSGSNCGGAFVATDATAGAVKEWTSSLAWMLAVQECAHHGCDAAVCLLTRYIPSAADFKATYVEKAGMSLTATLVLVASSEGLSTELRCAAVQALPCLQSNSLRAARYVRDSVRCVPLMALTLKQSGLLATPVLTSSLIATLRALTRDRQTLAAYVGSPWVWEAVLSLLGEVDGQGIREAKRKAAGEQHNQQQQYRADKSEGQENVEADSETSAAQPEHEAYDSSNPTSTNCRDHDGAAATLANLLALITQWFNDLSPVALLGMAASVSVVSWNMALSPPPPSCSTTPTAFAASHNPHRGRPNSSIFNSGPSSTGSPRPLPVLLQLLRVQLMKLARNGQVCHGDAVLHVEKALEHLTPLESGGPTAPT